MLPALIKSDTDTGQFLHTIRQRLSVSAFVLYITGTSDATGVSVHDVGRVHIRGRGNRDLVSMDFDALQVLADYEGGASVKTNSGSASSAIKFMALIPRGLGDGNVELIEPDDNYTIEINFGSNVAAHIASGFKVQLYALVEQGVCSYQLLLHQKESSLGTGTFTELYTAENIVRAYLTEAVSGVLDLGSGNISSVHTKCGEQEGFCDLDPLCYITNVRKMVESSTPGSVDAAAEIFAGEGGMSSRLQDDLQVVYTTSGSATPQVLIVGALINPHKRGETKAREDLRLVTLESEKSRRFQNYAAAAIRGHLSD